MSALSCKNSSILDDYFKKSIKLDMSSSFFYLERLRYFILSQIIPCKYRTLTDIVFMLGRDIISHHDSTISHDKA